MSCRDDYYFLKSMVKCIDIVNTNSLSGRMYSWLMCNAVSVTYLQ